MRYESTRDRKTQKTFREAVSEGLSPEGGLYLPAEIPNLSDELSGWIDFDYPTMATRIYELYAEGSLSDQERQNLVPSSLSRFNTPEVSPIVQHGNTWILELFHGPTLSFKDVALQTLGCLFEHWPSPSGQRTVLGATSGDTGSAAIAGVQGKKGVRAFILFPEGRVSPVQELQMTTVSDDNVQCLAIDGGFDDCQNIVKTLFADVDFREKVGLSAVNSINWARITSQIVYYFYAYFSWLKKSGRTYGDQLPVSVPTGNFGDILAGYMAKSMGLPLGDLIIASNRNDILTRFYETGHYSMTPVEPSLSPAMDIQISSNFERLLYLLSGRDDKWMSDKMNSLKSTGSFSVEETVLQKFRSIFKAGRASDEDCLNTIRDFKLKHNYTIDPHTAIGIHVADQLQYSSDILCLSTAHPGKFQEAVEKATGEALDLPDSLESLKGLPTRKTLLPPDIEAVRSFIERS
jgi:threonine synthase